MNWNPVHFVTHYMTFNSKISTRLKSKTSFTAHFQICNGSEVKIAPLNARRNFVAVLPSSCEDNPQQL